mgnify:CR=1 FL=1
MDHIFALPEAADIDASTKAAAYLAINAAIRRTDSNLLLKYPAGEILFGMRDPLYAELVGIINTLFGNTSLAEGILPLPDEFGFFQVVSLCILYTLIRKIINTIPICILNLLHTALHWLLLLFIKQKEWRLSPNGLLRHNQRENIHEQGNWHNMMIVRLNRAKKSERSSVTDDTSLHIFVLPLLYS